MKPGRIRPGSGSPHRSSNRIGPVGEKNRVYWSNRTETRATTMVLVRKSIPLISPSMATGTLPSGYKDGDLGRRLRRPPQEIPEQVRTRQKSTLLSELHDQATVYLPCHVGLCAWLPSKLGAVKSSQGPVRLVSAPRRSSPTCGVRVPVSLHPSGRRTELRNGSVFQCKLESLSSSTAAWSMTRVSRPVRMPLPSGSRRDSPPPLTSSQGGTFGRQKCPSQSM